MSDVIFCILPYLTGKIRSFGRTGTGLVPMVMTWDAVSERRVGREIFRSERRVGPGIFRSERLVRKNFRSETCLPTGRDQGGNGSE